MQTLAERGDHDADATYFVYGDSAETREALFVTRPDRLFRGRLHSLVDVPAVVATFKDRFPDSSVWFDSTAVNVLLDPKKMDQFFRLAINRTNIFNEIERLEDRDAGTFEQTELVENLRTEYAGYLVDTTFLPAVRQLKWQTSDTAEGTVEPQSAAMRQSVERAVAGGSDIPESIEFRIPVLDLPELDTLRSVRCIVTLDLHHRRIRITPEGDAISRVVREAESELREKLVELLDVVPVGAVTVTDGVVGVDTGTKPLCPLIGGSPSLIGSV